jgi:hypothetical protein
MGVPAAKQHIYFAACATLGGEFAGAGARRLALCGTVANADALAGAAERQAALEAADVFVAHVGAGGARPLCTRGTRLARPL